MQRLESLEMLREDSRFKFPDISGEAKCESCIIQPLKILSFDRTLIKKITEYDWGIAGEKVSEYTTIIKIKIFEIIIKHN
jgi:hypothetical protein